MKFVAESVLAELVETTPVDTSKAISNWQVALDRPLKRTFPAKVEGRKGSTKSQSAEQTLADGKAILEHMVAGESIYIHNDLDYIEALERGRSKQNSGFVERAIEKGRAIAEVLSK